MNPVVHFEMPYEDRDRMARFYEQVFGWKLQTLGQDMGEYVVAMTAESGEDGRPKTPGAINGGFFKKPKDPKGQSPSVVIAVEDINAAITKLTKAGGTADEPMDIPGVGMYASFFDTEGNRVSVLQPKRQ